MFDRNKDKQDSKAAPAQSAQAAPVASSSSTPMTQPTGSRARATIGATVRIKGDVSGDEDLLIEGYVEGTVSLPEHELLVGEAGKVHADLTAKVVRIAGEVQGDIIGRDKVIVASTSNITGNIMTPRMTLEEGARFKGCIDIDPQAGQKSERGAVTRRDESSAEKPTPQQGQAGASKPLTAVADSSESGNKGGAGKPA